MKLLSLLVVFGAVFSASAVEVRELRLAPLFKDHMVVASGRPVRVFGTGHGLVEVGFRGAKNSILAKDDKWCVELQSGTAGGPFKMEVKLDGQTVVIDDVMVGEVLLVSGQSNMQFKLGSSASDPATWKDNPLIRSYSTRRLEDGEPFTPDDGWVRLTVDNAAKWSAVAYETAVRVAAAKGCAVGIINCYQGASRIQAWMDAALCAESRFALPEGGVEHGDARNAHYLTWNRPGTLYRKQFLPLAPFSMSHVVWYQGESNTGKREGEIYGSLLAAMIQEWREDLRYVELPFTVVRLANFRKRNDVSWKAVQDAQASMPSRCELINVVDAAAFCEDDDIHPKTKSLLGAQIAESIMSR